MSNIIEIGTNFKNVRASLKVLPFLDIGTHMSLIKLSTGKFVIIDTILVSDSDKAILDELTSNGDNIEAVIGTHPFHTLYFNQFYKWYPKAKYYGTPRHLRLLTDVPWTGDITQNLQLYDTEEIFMRIPDGSDIDPKDENHFACVFVYHQSSKTLHVDDTIMCYESPGCFLRTIGCRAGQVSFWLGGLAKGIKPIKGAPDQFRTFMESILTDWDIDNLVTAHTGNKIGNAKDAIRATLQAATPTLDKLAKKYEIK
jgi:hypothetical protein